MQNPDSFDRIVSYFHALAREEFTYKGFTLLPYRQLAVSPLVFRSYTCPAGCGACCMKCSLVWDIHDPHATSELMVTINGISERFYTDLQEDNTGDKCKHLSRENGRCGIYHHRPLPCRLELFKFVHITAANIARALVRLPGRNWQLLRIDGERGAKCEIIPYDPELTKTHVADLLILKRWMKTFGIANDVDSVVEYLRTGPHSHPLTIPRFGDSVWQ